MSTKRQRASTQPITSEVKAALESLRERGWSYQRIADAVPMSIATLWKASLGEAISVQARFILDARLKEI